MVDDVILGCAMPEAEQGMNVARIASLLAGIPHTASAMTVNRFCSSGLQAIALAADADRQRAAPRSWWPGGTESMSLIPMGGHKISPNPTLARALSRQLPRHGHDRGARRAEVRDRPREGGRVRARARTRRRWPPSTAGRFKDEIVPLTVSRRRRRQPKTVTFDTDEGPRRDTDAAALAKLRPAFAADGHRSPPGNSSPDVRRRRGHGRDVAPSARRSWASRRWPASSTYAVAGVPPEIMGIGPVEAIPRALEAGGPHAGGHRPHRAERGLRRPGAGRDRGAWASTRRRST